MDRLALALPEFGVTDSQLGKFPTDQVQFAVRLALLEPPLAPKFRLPGLTVNCGCVQE